VNADSHRGLGSLEYAVAPATCCACRLVLRPRTQTRDMRYMPTDETVVRKPFRWKTANRATREICLASAGRTFRASVIVALLHAVPAYPHAA